MNTEDLSAHTPATPDGPPDYLIDHLQKVAELAARFGAKFDAEDAMRRPRLLPQQKHTMWKNNHQLFV